MAERFGGLDIVCNNAGISQSTPLDDYKPEEFDKIIDINVKGVLNGCQAASRVLGEGVAFFDGGAGTARQLRKRLEAEGLLVGRDRAGRVEFASSLDTPEELALYERFFSLPL